MKNNTPPKSAFFSALAILFLMLPVNTNKVFAQENPLLEKTAIPYPLADNENQFEAETNFVAPTADVVYNFNELPALSVWNTLQYPRALFYCYNTNFKLSTNVSNSGTTYPNFMGCETSPPFFGRPGVSFGNNTPIHNLTFTVVGTNNGTYKIDLYRSGTFSQTLNMTASCGVTSICTVDLRAYTNVTGIDIHSINDPAGLGFDDFSFNLGGMPPPPPPPTNQPPVGYLDGVTAEGVAYGWTRDPDNLNVALQTHLYIDCPAGPSCNGSIIIANVFRADVGSHGFNFTIPAQFRDGQPHTIYAYGIDSAGGANTLLMGSPRTFTLAPPSISSVRSRDAEQVAAMAGGDFNILHFVTPKAASQATITLNATISPDTPEIRNEIDWEGAVEVPGSPLSATLRKDSAKRETIKIKFRGTVIKELRAWVVWATPFQCQVQPVAVSNLFANLTFTDLSGARQTLTNIGAGERIDAPFNCIATINPITIITDANRPDLIGANISDPPGGVSVNGKNLARGANYKWDMSRRMTLRATALVPPFPPAFANDLSDDYPLNQVIGNDDFFADRDNATNPYSRRLMPDGNYLEVGQIASADSPHIQFRTLGGIVGDTYRKQLWFEEFARLEINGVWVVISDPLIKWRTDYNYEKEQVVERFWNFDFNFDGDMRDDVAEAMVNQDLNGDIDTLDMVGVWRDNGSISANNNNGLPPRMP